MKLLGLELQVARCGGIDTIEGCYRAKARGATVLVISVELLKQLSEVVK